MVLLVLVDTAKQLPDKFEGYQIGRLSPLPDTSTLLLPVRYLLIGGLVPPVTIAG